LLPFAEETQRFFFGREDEIREIFLRVRDNPLTVLYGQSGYGKTSLLNAGLIPKLRADGFWPIAVRFKYDSTSRSKWDLVDQTRYALALVCADENSEDFPLPRTIAEYKECPAFSGDIPFVRQLLIECGRKGGQGLAFLYRSHALWMHWKSSTLWECFHNRALQIGCRNLSESTPVLILDQFEEIFTLGAEKRPNAEIDTLAMELADLIENRPPASVQRHLAEDLNFANELDFGPSPLRVVITLREDYLSQLEAWKTFMPSLMRNRMALHLLRGPQAWEAAVKPGRLDHHKDNPLVSDEVGKQIVRVVARVPPETPLEEIEAVPPLLSLLCDELNRAGDGAPQITADLVATRHENILQEFYSRSFDGFPPAVREFVEDRFITKSGSHRNPVAREDAETELASAGVTDPNFVIDKLLDRRLLSAEERGGVQRLELTHDILVPLAATSRDKRQERERADRAEKKRRAAEEQTFETIVSKLNNKNRMIQINRSFNDFWKFAELTVSPEAFHKLFDKMFSVREQLKYSFGWEDIIDARKVCDFANTYAFEIIAPDDRQRSSSRVVRRLTPQLANVSEDVKAAFEVAMFTTEHETQIWIDGEDRVPLAASEDENAEPLLFAKGFLEVAVLAARFYEIDETESAELVYAMSAASLERQAVGLWDPLRERMLFILCRLQQMRCHYLREAGSESGRRQAREDLRRTLQYLSQYPRSNEALNWTEKVTSSLTGLGEGESKTLRIFVSSAGDMQPERTRANDVLQRLQANFRGLIYIDPIMWEHDTLATATRTQIIPPSKTDIFICILGARIGIRLPSDYERPDGSAPTGMEWELKDAYSNHLLRGTPVILVYRKIAEPSTEIQNNDELDEWVRQKRALDVFLERLTHDQEGTFKAAINTFATVEEFAANLEQHLETIIKEKLQAQAGGNRKGSE
jgi:hypothetical protein